MQNHHHHVRGKPRPTRPFLLESPRIDALYGLEPVFDPATQSIDTAVLGSFSEIQCPACWEAQSVNVDLTAGARTYIEDCQVCCHPMEITLALDARGDLSGVTVTRTE